MSANSTSTPGVKPRPYLMQNQVQPYEWGTHDAEAFIPQLLGMAPQPGKPYAELWMGAHPKAPSLIVADGATIALDHWITAHPLELLGKEVAERFNGTLPFLFKVLSAGEALSIQAHPHKAHARLLHANDPAHYPDDNHKPEVAVALDALTALMGIKPFAELAGALKHYPELAEFVGHDVSARVLSARDPSQDEQRELTKALLVALFTRAETHPHELSRAIDKLVARLRDQEGNLGEAEQLFVNLRQQYTGPDVGLFAIFLLNLVHLEEGQGMYAEAGVPHAYLKGNIVECMANSDNVVRVGLTSKFKDYKALLDILKYEPGPVAILGGNPDSEIAIYETPAPEFRVSRYRLKAGAQRNVDTVHKPEILIVTQGKITIHWDGNSETYHRGQSIFIPALLSGYDIAADQPAELFRSQIPA